MISFLRRMFNSRLGVILTLLFVGVVAIAFAAGDIGHLMGNGGVTGNAVATVDGKDINEADLVQRSKLVIDNARQQNPQANAQQFVAQGGVESTLEQLINGNALYAFGLDHGMVASKRLVDSEIAAIPAFHDPTGKFSQDLFEQMLRARGIDERALRNDLQHQLIGDHLMIPLSLPAKLPADMALPYASLLLEKRDGVVAAIPTERFMSDAKPTDQQLAAFYKANSARYTIPEQRKLRYAAIPRNRFMSAVKVSDGEIAAYYREHQQDYAARETRTLEQLIVPTKSAAQQILTKVQGGTSLAKAASDAGLSISEPGAVTRDAFAQSSSNEVAAAAFAAKQDGYAELARSPLGWHVVHVRDVTQVGGRPLESVRNEIESTIHDRKTSEAMSDFIAKLQDRISEGATFDEVIADNKLEVQSPPPLLQNGSSAQDANFRPTPDLQPIVTAGFGMERDDDPQVATIEPDQRYALVDVVDIIQPAPPPLAKVRDLIVEQWQRDQAKEKAGKVAAAILARVNKGASLADAIKAEKVDLPAPETVSLQRAQIAQQNGQVPPPLALLFSMPAKATRKLEMPGDNGWYLVHLDKTHQGDAGKQQQIVDAVRRNLSAGLSDEISQQFVAAVRKEVGVEKNASVIADAKRQIGGEPAPAQ